MTHFSWLFLFGFALAEAAHATGSPLTSSKTACQSLAKSLGPKVQSSGAQYNASAKGAWNVFNQLDEPTCIVFPNNSLDVVEAMKIIYLSDSHYAVRGGGHSAMPGWNTIQDGVLIDFSSMKNFSSDAEKDSITIEPGVAWGELYDGLQEQGVAPVGGREPTVGVSGLLLGGGLSHISPAHGFACDNYRSLDVVLPSGVLVTATRTNEYSDLFRALKGGASRFGIVTKFEVNAIHTGTASDKTWYGGTIQYPNSSSLAILAAIDNFVYFSRDPKAVALTSINYLNLNGSDGNYSTISQSNLFYNGTEAEFNKTFARFLSIPLNSASLGPLSVSDINKVLQQGEEKTRGNLYGTSALYPNKGLFEQAYSPWTNFSNTFKDELFLSTLAFTPVVQSQIDISNANGGTAFGPPDGAYAIVQIAQMFPPGVTSVNPEVLDGIKLLFSQIPRSSGLPLYINESNEIQDVFKTYNWYHQMKAVYAKYDPTRFNVRRMFGPKGL